MSTRMHFTRRFLAALLATLALGVLAAPSALTRSQGVGEEYIPFVTDFPKTGPAAVSTDRAPAGGGAAPAAGGLDWDDVAVGIGIGLGLSVLLAGTMLTLRARRQSAAHH